MILIDARKGVLTQTRRHSYLVSLLGIRHVVLAVNKMDLVGYDQARFDEIVADYRAFAAKIGIEAFTAIPMSALQGRQHHRAQLANTPWYSGPTLMSMLETVPVGGRPAERQAVPHAGAVGEPPEPRLPRLLRPDRVRRQSGRATGSRALPSGRESRRSRASSPSTATCPRPWPASRSP